MSKSNEDAAPITGNTVEARLASLVRRHGGTPKSDESVAGRIVLPMPKRVPVEGQTELDLDE